MKYLFAAALSLMLLTGCQSVRKVEYYEPTSQNSAYCTPTTKDTQGHGPVKSILGKSGSADWSDNKTFSLKFTGIGL